MLRLMDKRMRGKKERHGFYEMMKSMIKNEMSKWGIERNNIQTQNIWRNDTWVRGFNRVWNIDIRIINKKEM